MNIAVIHHALLGLFVAFIVSSCYDGHFKDNLVDLYGRVTRSICNGFIIITIKFLHFFVAKSLQMRLTSMLQAVCSMPSSLLLFWVP
ncbi:hypothetical protein AB3S75_008719 [Citrus x aurantiifolia]